LAAKESVKRFVAALLAALMLAGEAAAVEEICGSGFDEDASGMAGSCPPGEVDAIYGSGCDKLCDAPDRDGDGYYSTGGGPNAGIDCDDMRRDIYPGVTTSTDGGSTWKTCQSNGTYTSPSSSDFKPPGCGTTYYLDPVNGSNSNAGTSVATAWQTPAKLVSYYEAGDRPAGWHQPASSECVGLMGGTHSFGYMHGTDRVGFLFKNIDGVKFFGYPGQTVVIDSGGTSESPRNPFHLYGATNVTVEDITISGNHCYANGLTGDAGCFVVNADGSNVDVSRVVIRDNECQWDTNCAGFVGHSIAGLKLHHSFVVDNYDHAAGEGVANKGNGVIFYRGTNSEVSDSVMGYSTGRLGAPFVQKHANYGSGFVFKRNKVMNGTLCAAFGGGNVTASNNVIAGCDYAFNFADRGGTSYQVGDMIVENNTLINARALQYNPQLKCKRPIEHTWKLS